MKIYPVRMSSTSASGNDSDSRWECDASTGRSRSARSNGVYALIPARGGSKRIPGKNIKMFCGKPLIVWTIEQALRSKLIDRVFVSTDDLKIARIAEKAGAEVPFIRPRNLSGDTTPDFPVFKHFLEWCGKFENVLPDIVAHLRVINPMRRVSDIDRGLKLLTEKPSYDSVRAVIPAPLHPLKTYALKGNSLVPFVPDGVFNIHEPYNEPVQKLPKAYTAAGYFSAIRAKTILKKHSMTGDKILGYTVEPDFVVDIDTLEDFKLAESRMTAGLKEIR